MQRNNARPFNVEWARSVIAQCKAAGVACFVKQLGAVPVIGEDETLHVWPEHVIRDIAKHINGIRLRDRKGGDWLEWPSDLRVRQFPEVRR